MCVLSASWQHHCKCGTPSFRFCSPLFRHQGFFFLNQLLHNTDMFKSEEVDLKRCASSCFANLIPTDFLEYPVGNNKKIRKCFFERNPVYYKIKGLQFTKPTEKYMKKIILFYCPLMDFFSIFHVLFNVYLRKMWLQPCKYLMWFGVREMLRCLCLWGLSFNLSGASWWWSLSLWFCSPTSLDTFLFLSCFCTVCPSSRVDFVKTNKKEKLSCESFGVKVKSSQSERSFILKNYWIFPTTLDSFLLQVAQLHNKNSSTNSESKLLNWKPEKLKKQTYFFR